MGHRKSGVLFLKLEAQKTSKIIRTIKNQEQVTKMKQKKIETVAVLGTGAVGSYFVWGLQEKLGENIWVIAKGERKCRLETEGITINDVNYKLNVKTPQEAYGADLLLIATKYTALNDILDDIAAIVGDHTIVISTLNGVDSEEIVGSRIGMERILFSNMKISSQRVGSSIKYNPEITLGLTFGEPGQASPSPRMLAVKELFDDTPLHYQMSENIMQDIWYKFAFNVSRNLPQAIIDCGQAAYFDSEHVRHIMMGLRNEVATIAQAKGIDIWELPSLETRRNVSAPYARYSTLQDIDAGRHTEIDMFAGTVIRLGKELNIPTPYNEFAYHAIKALEEKNDGAFDYK